MINNGLRRAVFALLLLAGCHREPPVPPGYQGLVEYDEHIVSFEVAGRVDVVAVHRGDLVTAGQLLARLDDTIAKLTCDGSEQETNALEADLALLLAGSRKEDVASLADQLQGAVSAEELSRTTADRTRVLFAHDAIAKTELDKAETELTRAISERQSFEQRLAALRHGARTEEISRARARVAEARARLALEKELLARHELHAEGAGEITDLTIKVGELAATGTPAVTMADTKHPYVDVFVPEGELGGIRPGAHAELRVDSTQAPFAGSIESVSPETEFTPKFLFSDRERPHLVVRVRVRVDDPDRRLHAGVPAFARVDR
jgi:HlyD family secretion protein